MKKKIWDMEIIGNRRKKILNDVVQLFYLEKSAVQFQHWLEKMTISTKVLHIISTG